MQRGFLGGSGLVHSDVVNVSLVFSISGASSGVTEEREESLAQDPEQVCELPFTGMSGASAPNAKGT